MKAKIFVALLTVFMTAAASAQIPVTDDASIAMATAKWKAQYDQMAAQIEQLKQQFQSLTGSRGFGKIFNDPALRDYLPSDWQALYDAVKEDGYEGLSGTAQAVYEQNKIFDGCSHIGDVQRRIACEARAVKPAQDKGFALDAYDKAKSRLNQIDALMAKIDDAPDPKAIAELQARIAAEQAVIQNEQMKIQLYAMLAAAEDRLQQQREREMNMRDAAKRDGLNVKPMKFSLGN